MRSSSVSATRASGTVLIVGSRWRWGALVALVIGLGGCDSLGFTEHEWHSGDYVLAAIDTREDMRLYADLGKGNLAGLVDSTVFALGADKRYIVLKQHPATEGSGAIDRGVTNYFVVTRLPGTIVEKQTGVHGPMTKEQFEQLSATLHLPPFTKTLNDLQ
jgi:hypothetical protein